MGFHVIAPEEFDWTTRPHQPGQPARHVAELTDRLEFEHTRGNVWRYDPGARGRRHRHREQEEIFVVLSGTLSMYLGEPPERHDVQPGGVVHVSPGTELQAVNHGSVDLLLYAYGFPPEDQHADILDPAA